MAGAETKMLIGDGDDGMDVPSLKRVAKSLKLPERFDTGDALPPLFADEIGEFVGVRATLLPPLSDPAGSPKPESDPESL